MVFIRVRGGHVGVFLGLVFIALFHSTWSYSTSLINRAKCEASPVSRRSALETALLAPFIGTGGALLSFCNPLPARAYSESDLSSVLLLLRAQEATAQELNLLTSGKYKNLQRANVKLAVRFILTNYALSTNFAKLSGTDR